MLTVSLALEEIPELSLLELSEAYTPLTSLTATSKYITQNSTATTSGPISYTGTSSISLGGNITTNGANINLTGPVTLTNAVTADTTNAGAVTAGANIAFSSTINGAYDLDIRQVGQGEGYLLEQRERQLH